MTLMAHNLSLVMRKLFGVGKPREWSAACAALLACLLAFRRLRCVLPGAVQIKRKLITHSRQPAASFRQKRLPAMPLLQASA